MCGPYLWSHAGAWHAAIFAYNERLLNSTMDYTYSLRTTVQVVDQIGQWELATIASFTKTGYMVQFDGWGPQWHLEVSSAEMQLPVKKQSKSLLFNFFGLILLSFQPSARNIKNWLRYAPDQSGGRKDRLNKSRK